MNEIEEIINKFESKESDDIFIDIKLLNELRKLRHSLRCKIMKFIVENKNYFPEDISTGKLGHQINRKRKIESLTSRKKLGDTCDKELLKDAMIILVNIKNGEKT